MIEQENEIFFVVGADGKAVNVLILKAINSANFLFLRKANIRNNEGEKIYKKDESENK